jgi:NADPH-dependent 7-cyano-7-deazaguanine reductase QueF
MIKLEAIENTTNGTIQEQHTLDLPVACCPRSKNPRPGSTITIAYTPRGRSLEVGSLYAYLHSFVGGLRDDQGELVVRDMEGMIQRIAQDSADVLSVPVTVVAKIMLAPQQLMELTSS